MRRLPAAALLLISCVVAAAAQNAPRANDRAVIDACLQNEQSELQRCIGKVYKPCTERPPGSDDKFPPGSTPEQESCADREIAVWQEKIGATLKALRDGPLGQTVAQPWNRPAENKRDRAVPGSEIIDDMQRTWLIWSAKMCDTRAMRYEEGTFARTIYATCLNEETARHALWLLDIAND